MFPSVLCKIAKIVCNANLGYLHRPLLQNISVTRISPLCSPRVEGNVSVAYFHCSQITKTFDFPHIENEKFHMFMENMPAYRDVVKFPTPDVIRNTPVGCNSASGQKSDVFEQFFATTLQNVEDKLTFEHRQFHDLIMSVVRHLRYATDDELRKVLMSMCIWPGSLTVRDPMYKLLWNSVDRECAERVNDWDINFKLSIAEYFYHLNLSRITEYNSLLIRDLVGRQNFLSVPQLVQLMFYVNLQRDTPQSLLIQLEGKLKHIIKEINLQELSIICLGFFKTKNKVISMNIVKSILQRLITEISQADSMTISACFKFLRKSKHGDLTELYISLLYQAAKYVSKFDTPAAVHVAVLSMDVNVYIPSLLDTAMDKLMENKSTMRAKDGMKLLHCLAQFNHQPKPVFDEFFRGVLTDEAHSDELASYPRILFYSLLSYAYLGHYPLNLISNGLHPDFVKRCIDRHGVETTNPISVLNYCVEIECPKYVGPRVDPSILKMLKTEKADVRQNGRKSFNSRLISLTYEVLSDIYDKTDDFCIAFVLPHMFYPDIILRLNSKDQKPLSKILANTGNSIVRPPPHELWVCILVLGGYSFVYKSKRMNGLYSMKERQLKKLGYKVLQVPHFEAESASQLKTYMQKHLELLKNSDRMAIHKKKAGFVGLSN